MFRHFWKSTFPKIWKHFVIENAVSAGTRDEKFLLARPLPKRWQHFVIDSVMKNLYSRDSVMKNLYPRQPVTKNLYSRDSVMKNLYSQQPVMKNLHLQDLSQECWNILDRHPNERESLFATPMLKMMIYSPRKPSVQICVRFGDFASLA